MQHFVCEVISGSNDQLSMQQKQSSKTNVLERSEKLTVARMGQTGGAVRVRLVFSLWSVRFQGRNERANVKRAWGDHLM